jgi:uncharacterized protein with HEPN domain
MRDARHRLEDIQRAILDIRTFVADLDQAAFLKTPLEDRKTFRAVTACLQEIGEAVKALPPEVTTRHHGHSLAADCRNARSHCP